MQVTGEPTIKPYKVVFKFDLEAKDKGEHVQLADTIEEAETILNALSLFAIKVQDEGYMPDMPNVGFVFRKDDQGDWVEVDADDNEIY